MTERPRDVFLDGLAFVAAALAPAGFTYAKSRQRIRRARGAVSEEVYFQSSHDNASGAFVALRPYVSVTSESLRAWRSANSPLTTNRIAGGLLTNLVGGADSDRWNLADAARRTSLLGSLVDTLNSTALPWMALVEDADALVEAWLARDVPLIDVELLADYLVFLGRRSDAQASIEAWLVRRGDQDSRGFFSRLRPVVERHGIEVPIPG